jgi:hypothetical protein
VLFRILTEISHSDVINEIAALHTSSFFPPIPQGTGMHQACTTIEEKKFSIFIRFFFQIHSFMHACTHTLADDDDDDAISSTHFLFSQGNGNFSTDVSQPLNARARDGYGARYEAMNMYVNA